MARILPKRRGIFHKAKGVPYHEENSLRGIKHAAATGHAEIDLDLQMTKDNVIVVTHWGRPMIMDGFRDPLKKLARTRTVSSMTWAEVSRLRAGDYRITTLNGALMACAENNIGARLEPKGDKRFESVALWRWVKSRADEHGATVRGYSIRNLAGRSAGVRRVAAMNAAGISARVIH